MILARISVTTIITVTEHNFRDEASVLELPVVGIIAVAFRRTIDAGISVYLVDGVNPICWGDTKPDKVFNLAGIEPINIQSLSLASTAIKGIISAVRINTKSNKVNPIWIVETGNTKGYK